MFVNYVLYPDEAEQLHERHSITPMLEVNVGVLGHVLYSSFIKSAKLIRVLGERTARPFYTSYADPFDQSLVAEIYEAYLLKVTGVTCKLQFLTLRNKTYIYPIYQGNYLYFHDDECTLLRDLSIFAGRALLSTSAAGPAFCREQAFFPDVREQEGIYTCDSSLFAILSQSLLTDRQLLLEEYVAEAEEGGFFSVATKSTAAYVALELASAWNIPRTITTEHVILHAKKEASGDQFEPVNLGLPFSAWVQDAIERILAGGAPVVRLLVPKANKELQEQMISHNLFLAEVQDDFTNVQYEDSVLLQVPVFDLDDYRVLEKVQFGVQHAIGDKLTMATITEPKSLERKGNGWLVTTEDDKRYVVTSDASQEQVSKDWIDGLYFSLWGRYCLSALNFESVALIR